MYIIKHSRLILQEQRNFSDGLWDVLCRQHHAPAGTNTSTTHKLNILTSWDKPSFELANFLHTCAGSPTIRTFQHAINNNFLDTWSGINKLNMKYLITDPTNISMGHLDQERKNTQSTKVPTESPQCTYNISSTIIPFSAKEISYGDLTGAFPYTSSRGNHYLYVMYDHDSNAILVAPLKNRSTTSIVEAWKQLFTRLTQHGHETIMFILDNKFSGQLKSTLTSHKLQYQLIPPNVHCRNTAERAIKTFKNHFLSVLATADPNFPISEWDWLLPQVEMTLNLLRPDRCNPKLSSYSYLNGFHNFAKTPLAPAGTKVIIHMKP